MTKSYDGTTWFAADTWLKGGRYKTWRPIAKNAYLARQDDGSISLVLHNTCVVTYHQDGTYTYTTGGWQTVTTRRYISEFSPYRPHSTYDRKHPGWFLAWSGETSPARVQKCRTCKGEGGWVQRPQCHGVYRYSWGNDRSVCPGGTIGHTVEYRSWKDEDGRYQSNWDEHKASAYLVPCVHGDVFGDKRHRVGLCAHGQRDPHPYGEIYASECHRCHGEGVVDYGSKPIPIAWDGEPVRLDGNNNIITMDAVRYYAPGKPGTTPYVLHHHFGVPKPYAPIEPIKNHLDDETRTVLESALPGLRTDVKCPNGCCEGTMSISSMIVHLNDRVGWSREQIADWLDTLDADLKFPVSTTAA